MNLPTKLAITGLGVAVLMLLAFLTPAPAMAQIASGTTERLDNLLALEALTHIPEAAPERRHLMASLPT
jgi:hypothetical protein